MIRYNLIEDNNVVRSLSQMVSRMIVELKGYFIIFKMLVKIKKKKKKKEII